MIVEQFSFGAYTVKDLQAVSNGDQLAIGRALGDGLFLIPDEYNCDTLGLTMDGDYVAIRLGIYSGETLIGGWWFGAHEAAEGHTAEDARVYSRLHPGSVPGQEDVFWTAAHALLFVKYLLRNVLTTDDGTLEFVGVDYAFDSELPANSSAPIVEGFHDAVAADEDLAVESDPLPGGGFDNRVTLAP